MDEDDFTISDLVPVGSEMLLYSAPDGSYQVWAHNHGGERGCELFKIRDNTRLIESNKRLANDFNRSSRKPDGMMLAARVPNEIVAMWDREEWTDEDKAKWLNNPDNQHWRTVSSGWRF